MFMSIKRNSIVFIIYLQIVHVLKHSQIFYIILVTNFHKYETILHLLILSINRIFMIMCIHIYRIFIKIEFDHNNSVLIYY